MAKMRVIETLEVTTGPTCHRNRTGNWLVLCAIETPGTSQYPLRASRPKEHGTTPCTHTTGGPVGWTFALLTKAPIRDGLGQRFERRWNILNKQPVLASGLLQLINGKPVEIGVYGLLMVAAVILCGHPTEQDHDLVLISPKGVQQHVRWGSVGIDHKICVLG